MITSLVLKPRPWVLDYVHGQEVLPKHRSEKEARSQSHGKISVPTARLIICAMRRKDLEPLLSVYAHPQCVFPKSCKNVALWGLVIQQVLPVMMKKYRMLTAQEAPGFREKHALMGTGPQNPLVQKRQDSHF